MKNVVVAFIVAVFAAVECLPSLNLLGANVDALDGTTVLGKERTMDAGVDLQKGVTLSETKVKRTEDSKDTQTSEAQSDANADSDGDSAHADSSASVQNKKHKENHKHVEKEKKEMTLGMGGIGMQKDKDTTDEKNTYDEKSGSNTAASADADGESSRTKVSQSKYNETSHSHDNTHTHKRDGFSLMPGKSTTTHDKTEENEHTDGKERYDEKYEREEATFNKDGKRMHSTSEAKGSSHSAVQNSSANRSEAHTKEEHDNAEETENTGAGHHHRHHRHVPHDVLRRLKTDGQKLGLYRGRKNQERSSENHHKFQVYQGLREQYLLALARKIHEAEIVSAGDGKARIVHRHRGSGESKHGHFRRGSRFRELALGTSPVISHIANAQFVESLYNHLPTNYTDFDSYKINHKKGTRNNIPKVSDLQLTNEEWRKRALENAKKLKHDEYNSGRIENVKTGNRDRVHKKKTYNIDPSVKRAIISKNVRDILKKINTAGDAGNALESDGYARYGEKIFTTPPKKIAINNNSDDVNYSNIENEITASNEDYLHKSEHKQIGDYIITKDKSDKVSSRYVQKKSYDNSQIKNETQVDKSKLEKFVQSYDDIKRSTQEFADSSTKEQTGDLYKTNGVGSDNIVKNNGSTQSKELSHSVSHSNNRDKSTENDEIERFDKSSTPGDVSGSLIVSSTQSDFSTTTENDFEVTKTKSDDYHLTRLADGVVSSDKAGNSNKTDNSRSDNVSNKYESGEIDTYNVNKSELVSNTDRVVDETSSTESSIIKESDLNIPVNSDVDKTEDIGNKNNHNSSNLDPLKLDTKNTTNTDIFIEELSYLGSSTSKYYDSSTVITKPILSESIDPTNKPTTDSNDIDLHNSDISDVNGRSDSDTYFFGNIDSNKTDSNLNNSSYVYDVDFDKTVIGLAKPSNDLNYFTSTDTSPITEIFKTTTTASESIGNIGINTETYISEHSVIGVAKTTEDSNNPASINNSEITGTTFNSATSNSSNLNNSTSFVKESLYLYATESSPATASITSSDDTVDSPFGILPTTGSLSDTIYSTTTTPDSNVSETSMTDITTSSSDTDILENNMYTSRYDITTDKINSSVASNSGITTANEIADDASTSPIDKDTKFLNGDITQNSTSNPDQITTNTNGNATDNVDTSIENSNPGQTDNISDIPYTEIIAITNTTSSSSKNTSGSDTSKTNLNLTQISREKSIIESTAITSSTVSVDNSDITTVHSKSDDTKIWSDIPTTEITTASKGSNDQTTVISNSNVAEISSDLSNTETTTNLNMGSTDSSELAKSNIDTIPRSENSEITTETSNTENLDSSQTSNVEITSSSINTDATQSYSDVTSTQRTNIGNVDTSIFNSSAESTQNSVTTTTNSNTDFTQISSDNGNIQVTTVSSNIDKTGNADPGTVNLYTESTDGNIIAIANSHTDITQSSKDNLDTEVTVNSNKDKTDIGDTDNSVTESTDNSATVTTYSNKKVTQSASDNSNTAVKTVNSNISDIDNVDTELVNSKTESTESSVITTTNSNVDITQSSNGNMNIEVTTVNSNIDNQVGGDNGTENSNMESINTSATAITDINTNVTESVSDGSNTVTTENSNIVNTDIYKKEIANPRTGNLDVSVIVTNLNTDLTQSSSYNTNTKLTTLNSNKDEKANGNTGTANSNTDTKATATIDSNKKVTQSGSDESNTKETIGNSNIENNDSDAEITNSNTENAKNSSDNSKAEGTTVDPNVDNTNNGDITTNPNSANTEAHSNSVATVDSIATAVAADNSAITSTSVSSATAEANSGGTVNSIPDNSRDSAGTSDSTNSGVTGGVPGTVSATSGSTDNKPVNIGTKVDTHNTKKRLSGVTSMQVDDYSKSDESISRSVSEERLVHPESNNVYNSGSAES